MAVHVRTGSGGQSIIEVKILCSPEGRTLTQALTLGEGKIINVYTGSKYAYLVLHANGAIWKEDLNAKNLPVKYGAEISQRQLKNQTNQVTVIHCHGHQKGNLPNYKHIHTHII